MEFKGHTMMNSDFFEEYEPYFDFKEWNIEELRKRNYKESDIFTEEELKNPQSYKLVFHETDENGGLVLANGKVAGHRMYKKYFDQNLSEKVENNDPIMQMIMERTAKRMMIEAGENLEMAVPEQMEVDFVEREVVHALNKRNIKEEKYMVRLRKNDMKGKMR